MTRCGPVNQRVNARVGARVMLARVALALLSTMLVSAALQAQEGQQPPPFTAPNPPTPSAPNAPGQQPVPGQH
jgi:hypothetical protein